MSGGRLSGRGAIVDTTERGSIAAGQSRHAVGDTDILGRFQDLRLQVACTLLQTDHIIVIDSNKSLSAYCVRACKIKHFTEREFFLWRGRGILRFQNGNSRWPCCVTGVSACATLRVVIDRQLQMNVQVRLHRNNRDIFYVVS